MTRRRWWLALAAAALATAAAVYAPVGRHGYVAFDDDLYVERNQYVLTGLDAENVRWAFGSLGYLSNWHPLTWLSLMADAQLLGPSPGAFHLANLGIHLLSAALLTWALALLTGSLPAGVLGGALFALHPLHVESVAWISERKDVLAGLLFHLLLLCHLLFARRPSPGRYLAVAATLALGLLAKPSLVVAPFVLLLLDWWPLGRIAPRGPGFPVRRAGVLLLEKTPLLLLSALSSWITFVAQDRGGAMQVLEPYPLWVKAANAGVSLLLYLKDAVWPLGLAVMYPHPGREVDLAWGGLGWLLALTCTAAALLGARRAPAPGVGWLWFLGFLVPVLGFVQVGSQSRADRYTYLALTGLALAVAVPAGRLAVARRAALAAALVCLVPLTARQVSFWRDSDTLFGRTLAVTKGNWLVHNNLGKVLSDRGRTAEAEAHYREALRIRPLYSSALYNLGNILYGRGDYPGAERLYRQSLQIYGRQVETYNNLGNTLLAMGRLREAEEVYLAGIALMPGYPEIHNNLGIVLIRQGRRAEAVPYLGRALELRPRYAEAHYNLGLLLEGEGKRAEAEGQFLRALESDPGHRGARFGLARIRGEGGGG